jgi:uncharacterized protein (DUF2267 family)
MSFTGLLAFDRTLHETHCFLNEFAYQMGIDDKQVAFEGLRATLKALRDRIPPEEAAQLGAQLPVLMAGFYYQGWRVGATPTKERSKEAFLEKVSNNLNNADYPIETEELVRGVFKFLSQRISDGEIEDVARMMPAQLKDLWPEIALRA